MEFDVKGEKIVAAVESPRDRDEEAMVLPIPPGVSEIAPGTFSGATLPPVVLIPEGVVTIGAGAFAGHPELRGVSVPSSARFVGPGAFRDCPNLTNVDFGGRTAFAPDAFAGDWSIKWIRKGGWTARVLCFPRYGAMAIGIRSPQLSTPEFNVYSGRFCSNPGFPNCAPDLKSPLLYFCSYPGADGKERLWYDTLPMWAIRGAKYQALGTSPRKFLGRPLSLDGGCEASLSELGVILGIGVDGIKYAAAVSGRRRNERMPVSPDAVELAEALAPAALDALREAVAHQDEEWPRNRDYAKKGITWEDVWKSKGQSPEDGKQEVLQRLRFAGHLGDFNDWAY